MNEQSNRAPHLKRVLTFLALAGAMSAHAVDIARSAAPCPLPESYENNAGCVIEYLDQLTKLLGQQANELAGGASESPVGFLAEASAKWAQDTDLLCRRLTAGATDAGESAALRCKVDASESQYVFLESIIEKQRGLRD